LHRIVQLLRNRFFFDSKGTFVLLQWPNIPLTIWLTCTLISRFTIETTQIVSTFIGTMSLVVWSLLEITTGVNYFRRFLGSGILLYIIFSRVI
jgi:hypothetical protein